MTFRWLIAWVVVGCWFIGTPAGAGKQLGATTGEIVTTYSEVIVGRALAIGEDRRVRFAVEKRFHGEDAEKTVDVLVAEATLDRIEQNGRYLMAYTRFRKNPMLRGLIEAHPQGAVAVKASLLGEFVLVDRPEARQLLESTLGARGRRDANRRQARAALTLLGSDDVMDVRFAASELYGRRDLRELVVRSMTETFASFLRADALDPEAQDFLFRTARRVEGERPWLADGARDVLATLEMPLDPVSALPSLAITAMDALSESGTKADTEWLKRFVGARNPGVAKAAIRSMDALDRMATLKRADAWLTAGRLGDQPLLDETLLALRYYVARHEE